jgi:hypothetical protein
MLQYRRLCDNMTPRSEPAFSDAFFALLRAGVSESIENEIARTDYAVYDSADTMERINKVSRRLPNDWVGTKAFGQSPSRAGDGSCNGHCRSK